MLEDLSIFRMAGALAAHAELKQMEQMVDADIRITSMSLGKALRSAANMAVRRSMSPSIRLRTSAAFTPASSRRASRAGLSCLSRSFSCAAS